MSRGQIELVSGEAAHRLLHERTVEESWTNLLQRCPHSTAFQTPGFVRCWYASYRDEFAPVVVRSIDESGKLVALWLLAWDARNRKLLNAGGHQAEYHAWLAIPGTSEAFLPAAWQLLVERFDFHSLQFKYLPVTSLADVMSNLPAFAARMITTPRRRPLLRLDAARIASSFAKKSNKSRFNRLRRLGPLEFERITDPERLGEIFDEIIAYYDLRQGAVHETTPFRDDARKRTFHLALLAQAPEITHVTVTSVAKRPVAALIGSVSSKTLHVGILAYSPLHAEHSPGKLHLMQVERHLADNGFDLLDLTPGGDVWKERFASDHDAVVDVTLYRSPIARIGVSVSRAALDIARFGIRRVGLQPAEVREVVQSARHAPFPAIMRRARRLLGESREFRIYRADRSTALRFEADSRVRENCLDSLLRFEPSERWQKRSAFLKSAFERLESGESVFTITIDGRLAHSGWCVRNQIRSHSTEVNQSFDMPLGSVVLYDFQSALPFRGRGLYRATIGHILHFAVVDPNANYFYISVLADNRPSRHVIESMGFTHQGSLYQRRRLGSVSRWRDGTLQALP